MAVAQHFSPGVENQKIAVRRRDRRAILPNRPAVEEREKQKNCRQQAPEQFGLVGCAR